MGKLIDWRESDTVLDAIAESLFQIGDVTQKIIAQMNQVFEAVTRIRRARWTLAAWKNIGDGSR